MAAPVGTSSHRSGDHRKRKNGGAAEAFAEYRHNSNAERGKQIWVWDDESQKLGHWDRVPNNT
jgi:hypothetical protein